MFKSRVVKYVGTGNHTGVFLCVENALVEIAYVVKK